MFAGPLSLNWKVMAAMLRRQAGLSLLPQEVAGIALMTRLRPVTQVVQLRLQVEGRAVGLMMMHYQ